MALFHVSEEEHIETFIPRRPTREDLDQTPLVWAIDEEHLPNYLTPRDCPRVCYMISTQTTEEDKALFMNKGEKHVVVLEEAWRERLSKTTLYLYEFDPKDFELQDAVAGYYVSKVKVIPMKKHKVTDILSEFKKGGVMLTFRESLYSLADQIVASSFDFSLIRMSFAKREKKK